jgi:hypothetical protein
MIVRTLEQVLYTEGRIVARSAGVADDWQPELDELVAAFALPKETLAPPCLFTKPCLPHHQAIVSIQGRQFHVLLLDRECYALIPDPFAIRERFPPVWNAQHTLPQHEWPDELLPPRTTTQLNDILKNGDGPFLLGGCQTLVDGSKIILVRQEPANTLVRELWMLLPNSVRRQITFTTFAYTPEFRCHITVLPEWPTVSVEGYLSEDQARDYPESRYERDLQVAIEMNDQRSLDALLARKSSTEVLRMAFILLLVMAGLSVLAKLFIGP